ncbi:MAG: UDP-3-O-(3-hydroxymyristoyl)glucosamine N-acyltransferase [Alphaproteobacteria bacterium]|nr:UDP-3-O-(3-hydroxymyristoyl)glucosamine N-acyltransferase [Alphaproteobacteria bacterium]OJV12203.1 MAG: UDP-3-O-(3-hydroxymyristoyl)glucosamine N-acyltransferase [Alphaproteobacteria bacterium 33-17]
MNSTFYDINKPQSIEQIAEFLGLELFDNGQNIHIKTSGCAALSNASSSEISFFFNRKYVDELKNTKAAAVIIGKADIDYVPEGVAILSSNNPYYDYARLLEYFYIPKSESIINDRVVEPTAYIASSAQIGVNCYIGRNVVIEDNAVIGDNTIIMHNTVIHNDCVIGNNTKISSNCVIQHAVIGNKVLIHPNVSVGQDGFGFALNAGKHYKVPQVGRVIVHDEVEIGAGTTIDRGSANDTVIGSGTKIDNLVQIAHNVELGRNCIIVSQTGISGSTVMGDYVVTGGQSGFAGHLKIGAGVQIAAQSGVMTDIAPKQIYGGSPAQPIKNWHRQTIILKKLLKKDEK